MLYRKKQLIEVLEVAPNGDVFVQNVGNDSDRWFIPKDVFEETYEKVEQDNTDN